MTPDKAFPLVLSLLTVSAGSVLAEQAPAGEQQEGSSAQMSEQAPAGEQPEGSSAQMSGEETEEARSDAEDEGDEGSSEAPRAEDPRLEAAREHIARGEVLYDMGDFNGALAEFRQVFEILEGHPLQHSVSFNIGRCHERLYRYDQALRYYRLYIQLGQLSAEERAPVEARIAALEDLLGTVHLDVNAPAYEVWLDDHVLGEELNSVLVPGGSHAIEIRAPGYLQSRLEVDVTSRTEQTVSFELEELAEEFQGLHRSIFWTSTGLALASAAVAAIFGGLALGAHNDVEERLDDDVWRWSVTSDDLNHIDTLALTSDIFLSTTALFAVAAVILAFFTDWDGGEATETDERAHIPSLEFGPRGLGLRGALP